MFIARSADHWCSCTTENCNLDNFISSKDGFKENYLCSADDGGNWFFSGCLSEYNHVQMYKDTQENVHSYVVKMYISNMQSAQLVNNSSG